MVAVENRKRSKSSFGEKIRKTRLNFEIAVLKSLKNLLQKSKTEEESLTSMDVMEYMIKREIPEKEGKPEAKEIKPEPEEKRGYLSNKLIEKKVNDTLELIEEAQKKITKGEIEQARKTYQQAYKLYSQLPIEEQATIVVELQKIQKVISMHKKPQVIKKTISDKMKGYVEKSSSTQRINKINDFIEETQKQIIKGDIKQAKKTYRQAYRLFYKLPIEKQEFVLLPLVHVKEQMKEAEKSIEKLEIEELSRELRKLKSEREVYVIFDKSDIPKKLDFLTKYTKKLEEQGVYGLKAGKIHLKERLKELTESAEEMEKGKLTPKEETFLMRLKDIGTFYTKKEEALEKAFKKTQKEIFKQLHNITKQIQIGLHPKTKEKIIKKAPKKMPSPPAPKGYIGKEEAKELAKIENLLIYLKKKKEDQMYRLRPEGKEFLDKIEAMVNTIKEHEEKGVAPLKPYEKEFINFLSLLLRKKEKKAMPRIEEERRILEFLEHMKEEEMVHIREEKLKEEKEKLAKPLIETAKIKKDIERLKKLEKEEAKLMRKLEKMPKKQPLIAEKVRKKKLKKYSWETAADEVKKEKTKELLDLLKEEEKILSKLNQAERGIIS